MRRNDRIVAHLNSLPEMCGRVDYALLRENAKESALWKKACIDAVRAIRKVHRSITEARRAGARSVNPQPPGNESAVAEGAARNGGER
jgi:hypothetical protein